SPKMRRKSQCNVPARRTGTFAKRCTSSAVRREPSKVPTTARPLSAPMSMASRRMPSPYLRGETIARARWFVQQRAQELEELPLLGLGQASNGRVVGQQPRLQPGAQIRARLSQPHALDSPIGAYLATEQPAGLQPGDDDGHV